MSRPAPAKRALLSELTARELRAGAERYALQVTDRRVKTQLVDALARSRKVKLGSLLQDLSPDRLKELCRAFGLDDSGRRKADLAARLAAPAPAQATAAAAKRRGRGEPMPVSFSTRPERNAAGPQAGELSVAQLEQYLWAAADILRGSIDSSDYKTYIFGLLFLKRLSDRFEEEAEKLIAEGVPKAAAWTDPDEHQFFVPKRARWSRRTRGPRSTLPFAASAGRWTCSCPTGAPSPIAPTSAG